MNALVYLNHTGVVVGLAPPPGGQQNGAPWYLQLFPFVLLMVVFYVVLIRPQQLKAKHHAKLVKSLKPKDKVITSSGIVGEIISVKEHTVTLRSADTKLELLKSAVVEITGRSTDQSTA